MPAKMRCTITDPYGVVVLRDAQEVSPSSSSAADLAELGRFRPLGSYLLEIPSGQLVVSSAEAWEDAQAAKEVLAVTPGPHTVTAYSWEFDVARYDEAIERLVGRAEERFRNRVDKLYFLGCLPLVGAAVAMVAAAWQWGVGLFAAAIVLWLPYFAFKKTKRYQAVEAATRAYEKQLPQYVLQLTKVASNEGLAGGYVR